MQETVINTFHALFLSFALSAAFAPLMIDLLYRFNQVAEHKKTKLGGGMGGDNSVFLKDHQHKNGTPNMGGIIIWVIVPLTILFMVPTSSFRTVFLVGFLLLGLWGFIDVVVTNHIKRNPELRTFQEKFIVRLVRFILSVFVSSFAIFLANHYGLIQFPDFISDNAVLVSLSLLALSIVSQFAVYSSEITDGLDGLMIGMFSIIYTAMGALLLIQGQYELLPIIGIVIGSAIIDLYFNIHPARFFNGGPSAMPLGFGAFFIALLTDNLIPYFIISSVTWTEMFSSMIQIISVRFFKRRVFKIAPIHHLFQAVGWPETKVVMRFWLATMVVSVLGIYVGVVK